MAILPTLDELRAGESRQHTIPGADPIGNAAHARQLADKPLTARKAQAPCDFGLFGDSHKQGELF